MKRWMIVLCALGAVSAALAENGKTKQESGKTKLIVEFTPAPNRGELIYKTYCHHCHGPTGDGTGHIGKGLPVKPLDLTRPELAPLMTEQHIFKIVKEGMKANGGSIFMISWGVLLRDEDIRDVAAYTVKLAAEGRSRRGNK